MGSREPLHEKIDKLGVAEVAVVEQVVDAELIEIESTHLAESWLATEEWSAGFSARLRAHHAMSPEPLATTTFEAAFNGACEFARYDVAPAASATHRFFDTTVVTPDGVQRRISLKSSSAKGLKRGRVHISKLTEAAWIQDARRQRDRQQAIIKLFREYRAATDAILIVRCFRVATGYQYQLVEIATDLFGALDGLTVPAAQASTINFPPGSTWRDRTFALTIDGSDAKITVTGIDINACTVHGEWTVPNLSGVQDGGA